MLDLISKAEVVHDLIQYQHEQFSAAGHEETFRAIDHIISGIMDMKTVKARPVDEDKSFAEGYAYAQQVITEALAKNMPKGEKTDDNADT